VPSIVAWRTYKKNRQTRPPSSVGSRLPLAEFSGYVEVEAHYIFHPSTIWVRPLFTELGQKTPHFAKKQRNICRLSGDIIKVTAARKWAALRPMPPDQSSATDTIDWTVRCDWLQVASSCIILYTHNIILLRCASLAGFVAGFIAVAYTQLSAVATASLRTSFNNWQCLAQSYI